VEGGKGSITSITRKTKRSCRARNENENEKKTKSEKHFQLAVYPEL